MKARNVTFSFIVCLFLLGPLCLFAATKMEIDIPVALTSEPAQYLAGGQTEMDVSAYWSKKGFESKNLQAAIENELGRSIPCKANAIITNAALQRNAIAFSNYLYSWECYPTYFSSERIVIPSENAVSYVPSPLSGRKDKWISFAQNVCEIAKDHPEKRFAIYVVGAYSNPACSPAYKLENYSYPPTGCVDTISAVAKDTNNVSVLSYEYDSLSAYYDHFFRTDHHWNINGAFVAYNQICAELNLTAIEKNGERAIPDYWFTGATARWGVDLLRERVFDCGNDFSFLQIRKADGSVVDGNDHNAFYQANQLLKPYCFYDRYYDNLGECTIEGGNGTRSALLIGNSYRGALQRPLAASYSRLTVKTFPRAQATFSLEEDIRETDADDIILLAHPDVFGEEIFFQTSSAQ